MLKRALICTMFASSMAEAQIANWHWIAPGHSDFVVDVDYQPGTGLLLTADADGPLRLWDTKSGRAVRAYLGHIDLAGSVEFNPSGSRIASTSGDLSVQVWDAGTSKKVWRQVFSRIPHDASYSPDGSQLAVADQSGTISVFDAETGLLLNSRTVAVHAWSVNYSPDASELVVATNEGKVLVLSAGTLQIVRTLTGHNAPVYYAKFTPNGQGLVSGGADSVARLWQGDQNVRNFTGHTSMLPKLDFSADGTRLLTCGFDFTVRIWDFASGNLLSTYTDPTEYLHSVTYSLDNKQIAVGSHDNRARVVDMPASTVATVLGPYNSALSRVAISLDGRRVAATSERSRQAMIYDLATGLFERTLVPPSGAFIAEVDFSPNGSLLATADSDCTIWNVATGNVVRTLTDHAGNLTAVEFSPDGRFIATGAVDGTARLWTVGGKHLATVVAGAEPVELEFSPDSKQLAIGNSSTLRRLDTTTLNELGAIGDGGPRHIRYTPDGTKIVVAGKKGFSEYSVRIYDANTGGSLGAWSPGLSGDMGLAVLPDSKSAIVSCSNETHLFDLNTFTVRYKLAEQFIATDLEINTRGDLMAVAGPFVGVLRTPPFRPSMP